MWRIICLIVCVVFCSGCGSGRSPLGSVFPIHGINLGPYVHGQKPPDPVSEEQLRTRLRLIAPYCRWIRSYSCLNGLEKSGRIAHEFGLSSAVGAWLGSDKSVNDDEIANLIAAGKAGEVDMAIVGSEVLRVGSLSPDDLIGYIKTVKAELPGIPVTYADTGEELLSHPEVVAECDVVFFNHYGYHVSVPEDQAVQEIAAMYAQLSAQEVGQCAYEGEPDFMRA